MLHKHSPAVHFWVIYAQLDNTLTEWVWLISIISAYKAFQIQSIREVAGNKVAWFLLHPIRTGLRADLLCVVAARVEGAAGRRINRAGDLPSQFYWSHGQFGICFGYG